MDCIDVLDKLSEFYDKQLNNEETMLVRKHLKTCSYCAEIYETISRNAKICETLPEIEPPKDFMDRLHKELVKHKVPKKRSMMRWMPMCASAAAIVLIFAGWGLLGTTPSVELPDTTYNIALTTQPRETTEVVTDTPREEVLIATAEKEPQTTVNTPVESGQNIPVVDERDLLTVEPDVVPSETEDDRQMAPTEELYAQIRSGDNAGYISKTDAIAFLDEYEEKFADVDGESVIILTLGEWQDYLDAIDKADTQVSDEILEGGYKVIVSQ